LDRRKVLLLHAGIGADVLLGETDTSGLAGAEEGVKGGESGDEEEKEGKGEEDEREDAVKDSAGGRRSAHIVT
jgi:hypothetical protein